VILGAPDPVACAGTIVVSETDTFLLGDVVETEPSRAALEKARSFPLKTCAAPQSCHVHIYKIDPRL
jgi:hypothetical protein